MKPKLPFKTCCENIEVITYNISLSKKTLTTFLI